MTIEQEIVQYALDTGTYSFGCFDTWKIDTIDFYIEDIKQKFGIFESEIEKLVKLLEELKIINNVSYELVSRINPNTEIEGYAYTAEVSIPRIKDFIKNGAHIINESPKKLSIANELKPEVLIGKLGAYNDGTIRYGNEIIDMRNQMKDLCRLFMDHHNRLLTFDNIREHIIGADERGSIKNSTISKYVSELRKLLKIHFKKDVIYNQKEEGWYFKT